MRIGGIRRAALLLCAWACALPAGADAGLDQRIDAAVADFQDELVDVPIIWPAELLAQSESANRPVLLDVRPPAERAVSVLAGALTDAASIPAGSKVVVYCTVGLRSGRAVQQLRARGVDAVNLRGGILGWLAAGGVVVDESGAPTRRVHVYGRRWNLVPPDVTAVW